MNGICGNTEILLGVHSDQSPTEQTPARSERRIDIRSELSIESNYSLDLDEKTGCQSIELKATVDAALPVVEFLSLDDLEPVLSAAETTRDSDAHLRALQLTTIRLLKIIHQLAVHTVFILVVGVRESVSAVIHIVKLDIRTFVSVSVLWVRVAVALAKVIPGVISVVTCILFVHLSTPWRERRLAPGSPSQTSREHSPLGEDRRQSSRNDL